MIDAETIDVELLGAAGRRCGPSSPRRRPACSADIKPRVIQSLIGLACACIFLALALYRAPLGAVGAVLAHTSPIWLGAAMLAYAVNLALRAWRWQMILRPVAAVPYGAVARVLVAGYGLNTIMPLRLGELFRAEFFKRTYGLPRVQGLTSIVVERLFDGLAVVACLGAGLMLAGGTRHPADALIDVLGAGSALFGALLLLALGLGGSRMSRLFAGFPRLDGPMTAIRQGLAILRTWRVLPVAVLTLVIYLPDALSLWCIVKAVGLQLGPADTLVLVGAASLSTLLPSGPAFLGTLQFAYALALEFAGAQAAIGIAAATLAQFFLLLPVAIAAIAILLHGSGSILRMALFRREFEPT
ncbi:MAG TPA: lysylphosphatidylglycerol synthase transmembrane domain-containing protein [Stellaceae bacterium]|nr:lysylphosphatidylglycerol synthase transmembrane domain-containing protein [Stellaceae bacterium]